MAAADGPTLHRVTYYLGAVVGVEVMAVDVDAAIDAAEHVADVIMADASDAVGHLGMHLVGPPEVAEVAEVAP